LGEIKRDRWLLEKYHPHQYKHFKKFVSKIKNDSQLHAEIDPEMVRALNVSMISLSNFLGSQLISD
jgi:hypothetical protein